MDPISINRLGHVRQQDYLDSAEKDRQFALDGQRWTLRGLFARFVPQSELTVERDFKPLYDTSECRQSEG